MEFFHQIGVIGYMDDTQVRFHHLQNLHLLQWDLTIDVMVIET